MNVASWVGPLVLAVVLANCRGETTATSLQASLSAADDPPRFSDWSTPVNVGTSVNSAFAEQNPFISKDGLTLFFTCFNCPENDGAQDIWFAHRASVEDPWGPRDRLGAPINTFFGDGAPSLSRDGHRLYFNSNRPVGLGAADLYVSRRRDKRDDSGWETPMNLGDAVNSASVDVGPEVFADDETGVVTLYFTSDRPGGVGLTDIYASTMQPDGSFGPAFLVTELSTPFRDESPTIRRDGLEMFLGSDRPGSIPPAPGMPAQTLDIWVSTRASTLDPWSPPVNAGLVVNSEFIDQSPALSFNGTELYFHSPFRPGNVGGTQFDLWVVTRTKVTEPD